MNLPYQLEAVLGLIIVIGGVIHALVGFIWPSALCVYFVMNGRRIINGALSLTDKALLGLCFVLVACTTVYSIHTMILLCLYAN